MNRSASRSWFAGRTVVSIVSFVAASLLIATFVAASHAGAGVVQGGASPYVPTKGEWLCLLLNSRHALMNSERVPGAITVHYLYDSSNPDTLRIKVLYGGGTSDEQVRSYEAQAEQDVREAAAVRGWQDWLKIERRTEQVSNRAISDTLIR